MSIILGKIFKGLQIGRTIGFPTLNIAYDGDERGIFVGRVLVNEVWYPAAVHVGNKPTLAGEEVVCESHLLGFDQDIGEGVDIRVELLEKIRDVRKFENLQLLKEQIAKDVEFVKNWYNHRDLK